MRKLFPLAAVLALAWPAQAHDFWLQPASFRLSAPGVAPTTIQIGHGDNREAWSLKPDRIVHFRSLGPTGSTDHRAAARGGDAPMPITLAAPGLHLLVFESTPIPNALPAVRFNDYLTEEGLTPALDARARARRMRTEGREVYSRRAKTLVQVGRTDAGADRRATTALGLTLEIVPERNPYALRRGQPLPVRVLYEGKPLAGALVKLTDLQNDEKPVETHRTDASGRAVFRPSLDRTWLLNVVWTRPLAGDPRADFDTVFSSLSFGYPPAR